MYSLTLQTNDAIITANDILGRVAFAAPNESGAEAVKVVGKIEAQAEEAFDASNNATKIVFYLAADGGAATKMTLSSAGTATLTGNLIIADAGNIGSASDPDAIAIASDGVVSFSATNICPTTSDGTALGTGSKMWSDLFLATGSVVNFGNGDITLTHSSATLTFDGGSLVIKDGDKAVFGDDADGSIYFQTGMSGGKIKAFSEDVVLELGHASNKATVLGDLVVSGTTTVAAFKTPLTADADGATITFDLNVSNTHGVTLGDNRTLAISNESAGQKFMLRLLQDGTGSRTVTWFSTIKWADGTAPTLTTTASKADVFGFLCTAADTYDGFVVGQNI